MNNKFIKNNRGAIAVFLSLIMLSMTVFECIIIDGSRIVSAKSVVSGAGDLTMNAALTGYDQVLYEVYGLFASSETEAELEANLQAYFDETIQGAGIDASAEDIGNMLNLMMASGSALDFKWADGSELTNTDVLEQQILEYMKYRGPVNIGLGLLEKIEAFQDFNKQTEAMNAQLTFEENLDSLQDVAQKVYDKSNAVRNKYTSIVSNSYNFFDYNQWNTLTTEESNLEYKVKRFPYLNDRTCSKNVWDRPKPDDHTWDWVDWNWSRITSLNETKKATFKSNYQLQYVEEFVNYMKNQSSPVTQSRVDEYIFAYRLLYDYYNAICTYYSNYVHNPTDENLIYYGDALNAYHNFCANMDYIDTLQELYALLKYYDEWYKFIGEEESDDTNGYAQFYEDNYNTKTKKSGLQWVSEIDYLINNLDTWSFTNVWGIWFEGYNDAVTDKLAALYQPVYNRLSQYHSDAEGLKNCASELKSAICCNGDMTHSAPEIKDEDKEIEKCEPLCCIVGVVNYLEKKRTNWKAKIDGMPDGNTKTSMYASYQSEAAGVDIELCKKLYNLAIQIEEVADGFQTYTDSYTIEGNAIVSTANPEWMTIWKNAASENDGTDTYDCIKHTGTIPDNPVGDMSSAVANNEFYKFLAQICTDAASETGDEADNAKDIKDNLLDKGNESTDVGAGEVGSMTADDLKKVQEKEEENAVSSEPPGSSVSKDEDDKKVSRSAKKSLSNSRKTFQNFGDVLKAGRDSLYITEYAVGMFSCYTSNKCIGADGQPFVYDESDADVEVPDSMFSIAGNDLTYHRFSKNYNKLYLSEQEYILWGNLDGKKNVNNTLTLIFGIRLALNMLYAFTGDAEINACTLAWATAIAGWTGFGVPIVQSVMKIALALAETTYDITKLKDGYDVVLYKSTTTWVMKPSGLTSEFIDAAATKAQQVVTTKIDDAFQYAEKVTNETIDNVKTDLQDTIKKAQDTVVEAVLTTILSPVEKQIITLKSAVDKDETEISDALHTMLDQIVENMTAPVDGTVNANSIIIELLGTKDSPGTVRGELVSYLSGQIVALRSKTVDEALNAFSDTGGIKDTLKSKIMAKIDMDGLLDKLGDQLSEKVSTQFNNWNEAAQKTVGNAVGEGVTNFMNGIKGSGTGSGQSVTNGYALTMNYSEYVHLFLLINSVANKETFLVRIGDLVELNMMMRNGKFSFANAHTLLQLNARVQMNTTLLGKVGHLLDPTKAGQSLFTFEYRGLQGY